MNEKILKEIDNQEFAKHLLLLYADNGIAHGCIFFAEACINWAEKLGSNVDNKKDAIQKFYENQKFYEKRKSAWKEANNKLTERNDSKDSLGNNRVHIGFDTPGQKPGTWFSGIDKVLYEIVKDQKDIERFCKFGCRGSETDYSGRTMFYPN